MNICKKIWAAVATSMIVVALTGCVRTYAESDNGAYKSCSPSYTAPSAVGNFSIQQKGSGASLQWGIYPAAKYANNFAKYTATVMLGTRKYDEKSQAYPPHGSVDAASAKKYKGKKVQISGSVVSGKNRINYTIGCVIK